MREALKEACKPLHDEIEGMMYSKNIQDNSMSMSQLQHLLKINYFYFAQLEQLLSSSDYSVDFPIKKTTIILDDMKRMEKEIDTSEQAPFPLGLDDTSEEHILGSLYVAIGSSMGGQMIYKKLKENEGLSKASLHFFESAKDTIKLWKLFLAKLEERKVDLEEGKLIKAAQRNFTYLMDLRKEVPAV